MRISLVQLESFYWVARLGSFHAASRHQHLSQPTVSSRVLELEEVLGRKLFKRSAAGATLTPAGQHYLQQTGALLKIVDGMLDEPYLPMRGIFRVGANESAALTGLTPFLQSVRDTYPGVNIQITVDVGAGLREKLSAGAIDFSISTNPVSQPHISNVQLGVSRMVWVAAPGLVRQRGALTAHAMQNLPLMAMPDPSSLNLLTLDWFAREGIGSPQLSTSTSLTMMLRLVMAGLAVAILPAAIMKHELHAGLIEIVRIRQAVPGLPIYASFANTDDDAQMMQIVEVARQAFLAEQLIEPTT